MDRSTANSNPPARGFRGRWTPRTHCLRGHDLAATGRRRPDGRRRCRVCELAADHRRRIAERQRGLVRPQFRHRTHCRRGHEYTTANTRRKPVKGKPFTIRICRTCDRENQAALRRRRAIARPEWVALQGARVNVAVHDAYCRARDQVLRAGLRAAHPDHGGSRSALTRALAAYRRFRADEAQWYAAVGIAPPFRRTG